MPKTNCLRKAALGQSALSARGRREVGFTLIEAMVASLIFIAVTGACLSLYLNVQSTFENINTSSSLLHSGQRVLSRMSREIQMAGYPSNETFSASAVSAFPGIVAESFVDVSAYGLTFESDLDGDGQVEQVEYLIPEGSDTIERRQRKKNPDGTLEVGTVVSEVLLSKAQNRIQGKPLFRWQVDATSSKPFPKNVRTVFIDLILKSQARSGRMAVEVALAATCTRMNL